MGKKRRIYFGCDPRLPASFQFTPVTWWKELYLFLRYLLP